MSGAGRLGRLRDCECEVSGGGEWGDGKYWVRRKEWFTMTRWGVGKCRVPRGAHKSFDTRYHVGTLTHVP
jgi:hypothetical protein